MRPLLIALALLVPLSPVAPVYGCACDVAVQSADARDGEHARGARQDFCPCCQPKRPDRPGEQTRAVCRCRKAAPQHAETQRLDAPVRAPAGWTLESFAEASRNRTEAPRVVNTTPPKVVTPLRV